VNEMTIVNWKTRGMKPKTRGARERLAREAEGRENGYKRSDTTLFQREGVEKDRYAFSACNLW
jgi:hypothetical protein